MHLARSRIPRAAPPEYPERHRRDLPGHAKAHFGTDVIGRPVTILALEAGRDHDIEHQRRIFFHLAIAHVTPVAAISSCKQALRMGDTNMKSVIVGGARRIGQPLVILPQAQGHRRAAQSVEWGA